MMYLVISELVERLHGFSNDIILYQKFSETDYDLIGEDIMRSFTW